MQFWWVNQRKTYRHEISGGYMWSPKAKKDGSSNIYYDNMTRVEAGDIVFSYAHGLVKAVGIVASEAQSASKPAVFGSVGADWDKDGWLVDVDFVELASPVDPKLNLGPLAAHVGKAADPLQANGRGKEFYLAPVSFAMATTLGAIIGTQYQAILADAEAEHSKAQIGGNGGISQPVQTERTQVGKARVGQGIFKARVRRQEPSCRVTGVNQIKHLRASHIKPWSVASDVERLDGNNGLLLAPHVDHLFDEGFITFSKAGKLMKSKKLDPAVANAWALLQVLPAKAFSAMQEAYMAYHRANVFKG